MPQRKKEETDSLRQESSEVDREVLDVIQEQKRKVSGRGPRNAVAERKKKRLAEDGLRAIKAKDPRTFTELLRRAGIREGSAEWKNAWKAFYSA